MKITIASGKGGTGKTTVAVNLALLAAEKKIDKVSLYDCDVEAPNDELFIKTEIKSVADITVMLPDINETNCIKCGKCAEICNFHALVYFKKLKKILFFPNMCHSCGACVELCPQKCINEKSKKIGEISIGKNISAGELNNLNLVSGRLLTGEILSPVIIKKIFNDMPNNELSIIDAPPGTSCPVVQSVINADKCVLVTEPTPFGLYDLKLAVELLRKLKKEFFIVINKYDNQNNIIDEYCKNENMDIIARIPYDENIARMYSNGEILVNNFKYRRIFCELLDNLL
ncbi:MAG TPA: ATP-binding protein [bacterium]|nr:ATP-binding protein [bacterium]